MQVMIVKTSALGDVVQALEVLSWLHEELQEAGIQIEWVVERAAAPLVALSPDVSHVHVIDTKVWKKRWMHWQNLSQIAQVARRLRVDSLDAAIDLQGNIKSALCMRLLRTSRRVGLARGACAEWPASWGLDESILPDLTWGVRGVYLELLSRGLSLPVSTRERIEGLSIDRPLPAWRFDPHVIEESRRVTHGEYGLVAMGSRWPNKQIPATLAIPAIQYALESRPHETIYLVWGDEVSMQTAERVATAIGHHRLQLLPKGSLLTLSCVIQRAKWLISADSLALHLGSWMRTPTFGVYGPSSGPYYSSLESIHAFWQGGCPYGENFVKRCDKLRSCPTGACLKGMSAQPLLRVLGAWFRDRD